MRSDRRGDELALRWFVGDPLSDEEERSRLELAAGDALSAGEQAVVRELRGLLGAATFGGQERELVARVLERAARPSQRALRLIAPGAGAAVLTRSGPRAPSVRWLAAAAAAAAFAAGAGAFWLAPRAGAPPASSAAAAAHTVTDQTPARAELVFKSGAAAGGAGLTVGGQRFSEGAVFETSAGQACFTVDPGIDVCLGPHSRAKLGSLRRDRLVVEVEAGLCMATLSHRASGHTFAFSGAGLTATAKGTTFGMDLRGPAAEVLVLEGIVEVVAGAKSDLVPAHSRFAVGASTLASIGRAEEAQLLALLAPRALWRGGEVGILVVHASESGFEAWIDDAQRFSLPLETFVPTGKRHIRARSALGVEFDYEVVIEPGEPTRLEVGAVDQPRTTVGARAKATPSSAALEHASPERLLELARKQLKAGSVAEALAGYAELQRVFPASTEARTVLPVMGKLELEQRKNPSQALKYFDAYLRGPGPLGQEALSGRIRALRALGRGEEERRAIEQYAARYPGSLESGAYLARLRELSGR